MTETYDTLVFATGSRAFVPPVPGTTLHGVFVFRTIDDCHNIASYARGKKQAVVIGGGLLGLEAAKGLMNHGLGVTVVQNSAWLMNAQLDAAGGAVLRETIEKLGIRVLTSANAAEFTGDRDVTGVRFADGSRLAADLVVISAGIRPNKELAEQCGLACDRADRRRRRHAHQRPGRVRRRRVRPAPTASSTASSPRSGSRPRRSRRGSPARTRPRPTAARSWPPSSR